MPWFKEARNIGIYVSTERLYEVNTEWILGEILFYGILLINQSLKIKNLLGKNCYVPKVLDKKSNMDLYLISKTLSFVSYCVKYKNRFNE